MEVDNNNENTMRCYKMPPNVGGNLKISCDVTRNTVAIWSKYQLFVSRDQNFNGNFENVDFEIVDVVVLKDYVACLDCSGNINTFKFPSYPDSSSSFIFSIWKQYIKCICVCQIKDRWCIGSLQLNTYTNVNRMTLLIEEPYNEDTILQFEMPPTEWMCPGNKNIMVSAYIKSDILKKDNIFGKITYVSDSVLVIVSFDKRNIYAVLVPLQNRPGRSQAIPPYDWVKLYSSCMDIVDIKINMTNEICILIGLPVGTIVKIPFKSKKINTYHLNTSIHKFLMKGNSVIYTDALTMWKTGNTFFEPNSANTFEQLKVRTVRDFCVIENNIICITFSNLIYICNINDESSYINSNESDNTCETQLVTNSDYLKEIKSTVRKNKELINNINKESAYLLALSLSQKKHMMEELIQASACVFDDYRDISSKNYHLTLTDNLDAYYDPESYYFLINIAVKRIQHKLNKILSDVLDDLKIHISIIDQTILKTTSVQIKEKLMLKNIVIPLKRKNMNIRRLQIQLKIITNISGDHIVIYEKYMDLNAENFINLKTSPDVTLLKNNDDLDMLIYKRAVHVHKECTFQWAGCQRNQWTFYVKLPNCNLTSKDILGLINSPDFNSAKSNLYKAFKHLENASEGKNYIEFQVGNEKVTLDIVNQKLVITCADVMVASDIRNFLSNVIFNSYKNSNIHTYYIASNSHLNDIKNMKSDVDNIVSTPRSICPHFGVLLNKLLNEIYCSIPI